MRKIFATGFLFLWFALGAAAQDSGTEADETEPAETEVEAKDEPAPADESYVDSEDDDFRPSEDIPADQSIPFPTDI